MAENPVDAMIAHGALAQIRVLTHVVKTTLLTQLNKDY